MAQKLNVLYLLVKKPDIPFVEERHKNNNTNQLQGKTSLNEIR